MRKFGVPSIVAAASTMIVSLAFIAQASAFRFPWNSTSQTLSTRPAEVTASANESHQLAPAGAPEPNEVIPLPSWAPLVKRVMPTVVNVAITEEVKTAGYPFVGNGESPGSEGQEGSNNPFGFGGNPFGPFGNFQYFFNRTPPRQFVQH